ncbi:MAG: hypothetical protein KGL35_16055, partial [Bradyrhizobium sp.]|nr:hypothetical protein [Bradyrhizobium sp.]
MPSSPGFVTGQVPTASQWNSYFSAKADYGGDGNFATVESSGTATLGNASANYLTFSGATTGNGPTISAAGSDANINVHAVVKGTGVFEALRSSFGTSGGSPALFDGTPAILLQSNPT